MDPRETAATAAADSSFGVVVSALAVLAAGALTLPFVSLGPLSAHMAVHIAAMNVAAPLAAVALARFQGAANRSGTLWIAAGAQLALLWTSHSPALYHAGHAQPLLLLGMHAALFLSALLFWRSVASAGCSRWQAMLALLVSGKLACLLGVLLIFAPRPLFAPGPEQFGHAMPVEASAALADQHLAGLLMVAACPLSYVLAAVVIAAQTILSLDSHEQPTGPAGRMPAR